MHELTVLYVVGQKISYEDTFAAFGQNVTIQCHGSTSKPVVWQYKNTAELYALDLYDEGLISAYEKKYTVNDMTYDLTICAVTLRDAGKYWCVDDEGFGVKHVTQLFVTGNVLLLLLS